MKGKKWTAVLAALGIGGLLLVSYPIMTSAADAPAANNIGVRAAMGRWSGNMVDTISKLLGMDQTEIIKERQAGKSMVDIAETKGVDAEKLVNTVVEERKALLDQRVKDGLITEEQAEYCTENMEQRIEGNLNRASVGPGNGCGMRGGRGPGSGSGGGFGRGMNGQGYGGGQGYGASQQSL